MTTGTASFSPVVTPRTPATKNEVWVPVVPMRIAPLSPDDPALPISMLLLLEPETLAAAPEPIAMLPTPVVLFSRANSPYAVLSDPEVLDSIAAAPPAVLL